VIDSSTCCLKKCIIFQQVYRNRQDQRDNAKSRLEEIKLSFKNEISSGSLAKSFYLFILELFSTHAVHQQFDCREVDCILPTAAHQSNVVQQILRHKAENLSKKLQTMDRLKEAVDAFLSSGTHGIQQVPAPCNQM
jgi:hypothetical protein